MTNEAAIDIRQWLVSARTRGELLATSARGPGIDLVMVGVPAGYSAEEVEGWLRDLIGMSIETSSTESGGGPIPALLHHLLTGLIFSHSELWDRAGASPPNSMAFVRTPREVAFGWVGGPPPDLWIDDFPAQVEWVCIRDHDGHEAFALSIDPAHRVRVHFGIGAAGSGATAGASVDAAWVPEPISAERADAGVVDPAKLSIEAGASTAARPPSTISRAVGARASTPSEPLSPAPILSRGDLMVALPDSRPESRSPAVGDGKGWTVVYDGESDSGAVPPPPPPRERHWWSNVVDWVSGGGGKDEDEDPGAETRRVIPFAIPDRIPPTPEPVELTERTAPPVLTESSPGTREIQLSPLSPEDPAPDSAPHPTSVPAPKLQIESVHLEAPVARTSYSPAPRFPPAASTIGPESAAVPGVPRAIAAPPVAPPAVSPVPAPSPSLSQSVEPDPSSDPLAGSPFLEPFSVERRAGTPGGVDGRVPMRPRWADATRPSGPTVSLGKPWMWGAGVVVLFLVGWLVGGMQNDRPAGEPGAVSRTLRAMGLGGARFDVQINSRPPGAWIAVDGKDLARRTPATVDLPPGSHQVSLSFSDLGAATFEVRGVRDDRVTLEANLWGLLSVYAGDGGIPVAVAVDGVMRGLAPVTVDSLMPGTHEVRFSGPGLQPWGQTVQVRVRETAQLVARAVTSPATGVLEIHALWTDAEGSEELAGATVYVDAEKRGETPMTLELPRGPHSVRIESRGEDSPVQVIDLPGGNQRFASFELGLGIERPSLAVLGTPVRVPLDQPAVLSAALQGMHAIEAREMWLHVRQPDGAWRRYPMNMMKAPGGIVGTAVFPNTLLDPQGETPFYVSASNQTGDDFYSEIQIATELPGTPKK